MSLRSILLAAAAMLVACTAQVAAQQSLGELVSENGYDWIIGKWATSEEGEKTEAEYKWGLDKHIILVDVKRGDFKYHGIIMFVPSREEVIQIGADNQGGVWKGTWSAENDSAVYKMEHIRPDGEIRKYEFVHSQVNAEAMKVAMYAVEDTGSRASEPRATPIYKRQTSGDPKK